jgi:transketolase
MRKECARAIEEMALADPRVVVVASDPSYDFMPELSAKCPERLMIEGVCEQALVGMSAGLASEGFYPFIFMLAVFGSRRCYEQLLLDFGLHGLSGCVIGAGGGLTYAALGPTHIAVDDFSLVSSIPGSAVLAPGEPREAVQLVQNARDFSGLSFVRLAPTSNPLQSAHGDIVLGRGRTIGKPGIVLFVSCGAAALAVQEAVDILGRSGVAAGAIHLHTVKPLDINLIRGHVQIAQVVICVEEHRQVGGLSSAVLHGLMTDQPLIRLPRFASVGVDDKFPVGYGSYEELMAHYGITGASLAERAISMLPKHLG